MTPTTLDEVLRLRQTLDQAQAYAGQANVPEHAPGALRVMGRVVNTLGSPNLFYKLTITTILGTEAEGQAVTQTTTTNEFLAFNIGDVAPPAGAIVTATFVPYRWVFTYGKPAVLTVSAPPA